MIISCFWNCACHQWSYPI